MHKIVNKRVDVLKIGVMITALKDAEDPAVFQQNLKTMKKLSRMGKHGLTPQPSGLFYAARHRFNEVIDFAALLGGR
jgi:hypothetical protein